MALTLKILVYRVLNHCFDFHWLVHCIIDGGGEGVIMQQLGSSYEHGRSSALIKLKVVSSPASCFFIFSPILLLHFLSFLLKC